MNLRNGEPPSNGNIFWSWGGRYVGVRVSDGLFYFDGRQLGFFAEGDEVYGCDGTYLGEVRLRDRLIRNIEKKAWTRRSVIPSLLPGSRCHADLKAREMPSGYEDFPTAV